jgi:hypothetical protein
MNMSVSRSRSLRPTTWARLREVELLAVNRLIVSPPPLSGSESGIARHRAVNARAGHPDYRGRPPPIAMLSEPDDVRLPSSSRLIQSSPRLTATAQQGTSLHFRRRPLCMLARNLLRVCPLGIASPQLETGAAGTVHLEPGGVAFWNGR